MVDIGGGSLELAAGRDEDPSTAVSLPLGAGRLTRHLPGEVADPKQVKALRRHIRAFNIIGGVLLVLVGVLMVTGIWTLWIYQLQNLAGTFTTPV
mgnify:CR=1 FL=1